MQVTLVGLLLLPLAALEQCCTSARRGVFYVPLALDQLELHHCRGGGGQACFLGLALGLLHGPLQHCLDSQQGVLVCRCVGVQVFRVWVCSFVLISLYARCS